MRARCLRIVILFRSLVSTLLWDRSRAAGRRFSCWKSRQVTFGKDTQGAKVPEDMSKGECSLGGCYSLLHGNSRPCMISLKT